MVETVGGDDCGCRTCQCIVVDFGVSEARRGRRVNPWNDVHRAVHSRDTPAQQGWVVLLM